MSLEHLFRPAGIAVVGASDRRTSNGFIVTNNLVNNRFAGRIVPVNPRLGQLLGLPTVRSLTECAGQVDLAVLMVRADLVASVYTEAAQAGVTAVSIAGDLPTSKRELEIISGVLADGGPRILGPGSVGTIDCPRSVMASMSSALLGRRLVAGGLSIVSQSGGLLGTLLNRAADHGIGISKAVSLGQEFDIGLGELVSYLADDPATTTIACVLEGLRQPEAFVEGVRRAHRNGKQVSVFRIGRSTAGQQSALAHSGALAVPNRTYTGLFDQLRVLQVDSVDDLLAVVYADPSVVSPHGSAVGVASLSGGCCGAFADACEVEGVRLARLTPETVAAAGLPAGQLGNPLDLVSNAVGPEVTEHVLTQGLNALEGDAAVGAVVYADSVLLPIDEVADTLIQRHCERSKPLVVAWDLGSQGAQAFARLQQAGVPTFRSLRVAARWLQLTLRERHTLEIEPTDPALLAGLTGSLDPDQEVSTEAELSPVLARLGIPMAASRLVHSSAAAGEAATAVGTPVAVKVISPQLLHRHAVGAVVLNLSTRDDAVGAADSLLAQHPMKGARDGLLVQRMVGIGDEYFIGLHRDTHLGLLMLFGRGGVNVERDGTVVARRLPMTAGEIAEMVAEVDGEAPIAAISEVAYRLTELGQSLGNQLLSLEINPLVTPLAAPDTVLGLDALATFAVPARPDTTTAPTSINTTEDTYV